MGESDKAIQLIEKSVALDPNYVSAWQNLGNVYRSNGDLEKAESCYRSVVEAAPAEEGAWSNLCIVLQEKQLFDEAQAAGARAVALAPGSKIAWYNLANAFKAGGLLEEAVEAYEKVLGLDSQYMQAHEALCAATYQIETKMQLSGDLMERTRAAFRRWLQADADSPISRHVLSAFNREESLARAPDDYITTIFDPFSESFDQNLEKLDYRVPRLMTRKISQLFKQAGGDMNVLDAGCGTGLLAKHLRPWAKCLVGVDLSAGMLAKARARGLYDELSEAELGAWLADCRQRFELVICADTLIYFGDLEGVLEGFAGTMAPGAILLFTLERNRADDKAWSLSPNGRYSHGEDYVRKCLNRGGLTLVDSSHETLRQEGGQDVEGLLLVARRDPFSG